MPSAMCRSVVRIARPTTLSRGDRLDGQFANSCTRSPCKRTMQAHRASPPALRLPDEQRRRTTPVVEVSPLEFEDLAYPQAGAPHDEHRGASLMPIVRRQRVQQTAHLVGSPVMWYFHDGRIHLDELCQKDPLSPDGLRVEATADPTKVAELCANSATDNAPSADDDERKEHRSRCPLSKGDDS